jgi:hypothetical protein
MVSNKIQPSVEVEKAASSQAIEYKRTDTFRNEYADNVFLESTAWDLKMVFGQIDLSLGPNAVVQHTGITLPWPQVKVLQYFLQVHLTAHEMQYGHLMVPPGIVQQFPPPTKEQIKDYPNALLLHKALVKLREEFLADNPEAAPPQPPSHEN